MERTRKTINLILGSTIVASAILVLIWLSATKPKPKLKPQTVNIPQVEVLTITPTTLSKPIVGYGTVRPKRQVKIIPEVNGQLLKVHKELAVGNTIPKGELLFEIDPREYKAKIDQILGEISRLEAQLSLHEEQSRSLAERLTLARQQADLAKTAFDRDKELFEKGSANAPELEASEDRYLRQLNAVLGYESELASIPHLVEETKALLRTKRSQLSEAEVRLEKTRITCPFNARVDSVSAQETQVVIAHMEIATLTDLEALEVAVAIDPRELRWTAKEAFASALGKDLQTAPEAKVTWTLHEQEFSWKGKVTRLERMDKETRSAYLVVEIQDVMSSLNLNEGSVRPPLSVGMFCRTEIPTAPLANALLVPRHAIYDSNTVYVFQPNSPGSKLGKLGIKHVPVLRSIGENVLVSFQSPSMDESEEPQETHCELAGGDMVIVSQIPRPVAGMELQLRDAPSGEQKTKPIEQQVMPGNSTDGGA